MQTNASHTACRRAVRRTARRGFTLLEMMVVVTIIALLATLIGPKVFQALAKGNASVAKQQTKAIQNAVMTWMMDNNHTSVPPDFELAQLTEGDARSLAKSDLVDPWGNEYLIDTDGYDPDFDIVSLGADGQPGGEDDAMDIINGKSADQY